MLVDILLDLDFNLNEFCGITDEELAISARSDSSAANALILRYSKLIFIKAEIFSSHGSDPDDLRQEGLMGLLKAIASFDADRGVRFSTFAEVCIVNRMRDFAANSGKDVGMVQSLDDMNVETVSTEDDPESIYINKEFFSELWHIVDNELSELEGRVFTLFIRGRSYREIAETLGITEKAADNAMQRARKKIRDNVS